MDSGSQDDDASEGPIWSSFRGGPRHSGASPYDASKNGGGLKWMYNNGNFLRTQSRSIAIATDGTIYMGASEPNGVLAISQDGERKWLFSIDSDRQVHHSSPAIGNDGTIYIGAGEFLYAIDPNGTELWHYETEGHILTSPAVGQNGVVYFGSIDANLYAVNPNGTLFWNFTAGYDVESSPAVGPDGTIVFSCYLEERSVVALFPNGTMKWVLEHDDIFSMNSPAIGLDGTIYINGGFRNLYSISPNGTINWIYPTVHGSEMEFGHINLYPAIGPDGVIYSGSVDGLYAVNPDGTLKWREGPRGETYSPSVSGDGTIFARTMEGITAFRSDGTVRWVHREEWALVTELAIGKDGTVYYYNQNDLIALNGDPVFIEFLTHPLFIMFIVILIVILLGLLVRSKRMERSSGTIQANGKEWK